MTQRSRPKLLIPVVFPEPKLYPLTETNIRGLDGFDIVLFGYWEVPEGTTVTTARGTHKTEAQAVLYEMAAQFSHAGAVTDTELHFGSSGADERELLNQIVGETDPEGVLFADRLASWTNVLVPLRDSRHQDQIVDFVSEFHTDNIFVLELYHAASNEDARDKGEEMLEQVENKLLSRGFSEPDIEVTVEIIEDRQSAVAAKARKHNVVVIGETEDPDVQNRLFGPMTEYIDSETDTPIVVVRECEA